MKTKVENETRNRKDAPDRPKFAENCRTGVLSLAIQCKHGHDFRFAPGDRYGCCAKCGAEVLT